MTLSKLDYATLLEQRPNKVFEHLLYPGQFLYAPEFLVRFSGSQVYGLNCGQRYELSFGILLRMSEIIGWRFLKLQEQQETPTLYHSLGQINFRLDEDTFQYVPII